MIVNRRCSPFVNDSTPAKVGGRRFVAMKINSNSFTGFNNWKIFDLETGDKVRTFNKNSSNLIYLGDFMPGEGKLYRIAPVMQEGGELVTDEVISGTSFTCKDTVISNGKNITFEGHSNTVSFSDSGLIIMGDADFTAGNDPASAGSTPNRNSFKGLNGHTWNGLKFTNCIMSIYETKFENIGSPEINFAVSAVNCQKVDIRNNVFISTTDTAGGINCMYYETDDYDFNLFINYNSFTLNNSRATGIKVQGFSDILLPVYIGNNTMTSNGYATGILISSVPGSVIKFNTITGFSTGMNFMFGGADLYANSISNTSGSSESITATSYSAINLSPGFEYLNAGSNSFVNTSGSGSSKNIYFINSAMYLTNGYNSFDIHSTGGNLHIQGFLEYIPEEGWTNNCFRLEGSPISSPDEPFVSLLDGYPLGTEVDVEFIPYSCNTPEPDYYEIADIGFGLYDTIPTIKTGGGGGEKRIREAPKISESGRELFDSINIALRFRNYDRVKNLCYELISSGPESIERNSSLSKLYLSVIRTDTSSGAVNNLKTFYESLILNNPEDTMLIAESNYLIQKCKVVLRQYQLALNGFNQIIDNNPYSYEGLLARWDYAATSLMLQGSGGGDKADFNSEDIDSEGTEYSESPGDEPDKKYEKYDKKIFTNEQRKEIRNIIFNAVQSKKQKDEEKITKLGEASRNGDEKAGKELNKMKTLKEINKTYKPENIQEHIRIVNSDFQKVFGNKNVLRNGDQNSSPTEYNLSQNFPNPFNPVTKIKFDLPQDGNVKLIIYDLLGREVVRLINNEFRASGRYIIEFNGVNLASGLYFYRLESDKFTQTKRMIFLK